MKSREGWEGRIWEVDDFWLTWERENYLIIGHSIMMMGQDFGEGEDLTKWEEWERKREVCFWGNHGVFNEFLQESMRLVLVTRILLPLNCLIFFTPMFPLSLPFSNQNLHSASCSVVLVAFSSFSHPPFHSPKDDQFGELFTSSRQTRIFLPLSPYLLLTSLLVRSSQLPNPFSHLAKIKWPFEKR